MREEQALEQLRLYLWALQKYRSIAEEEMSWIPQETKETLSKWVFGERAEPLLAALALVIDRGFVTTMEYYNFMVILWRFTPEIAIVSPVMDPSFKVKLPTEAPNTQILVNGWDEEER